MDQYLESIINDKTTADTILVFKNERSNAQQNQLRFYVHSIFLLRTAYFKSFFLSWRGNLKIEGGHPELAPRYEIEIMMKDYMTKKTLSSFFSLLYGKVKDNCYRYCTELYCICAFFGFIEGLKFSKALTFSYITIDNMVSMYYFGVQNELKKIKTAALQYCKTFLFDKEQLEKKTYLELPHNVVCDLLLSPDTRVHTSDIDNIIVESDQREMIDSEFSTDNIIINIREQYKVVLQKGIFIFDKSFIKKGIKENVSLDFKNGMKFECDFLLQDQNTYEITLFMANNEFNLDTSLYNVKLLIVTKLGTLSINSKIKKSKIGKLNRRFPLFILKESITVASALEERGSEIIPVIICLEMK
jgi:hypothetical protein